MLDEMANSLWNETPSDEDRKEYGNLLKRNPLQRKFTQREKEVLLKCRNYYNK